MKSYITILLLILLGTNAWGQNKEESLLDALGETEETNYVTNAFKSPRVINSQSIEMLAAGTLDFRILHRFGMVNQGYQEFFGLDQASMRLGFDYGVTPNFTLGVGRSTVKKELDGFVRYRLLWQSSGKRTMPISAVWVSGITLNTLPDPLPQPDVPVTLSRRLAYYHQLIVGRKFSNRFTLQFSPTLVHQNIVDNKLVPNDLFALGVGGRYKLSQRIALVWDYAYPFNRFPPKLQSHPLSLGVDIETGGHVFQLHFSNATGMNERAFLTDENGDWLKGDIRFGFNLSRVFQIKKNNL